MIFSLQCDNELGEAMRCLRSVMTISMNVAEAAGRRKPWKLLV